MADPITYAPQVFLSSLQGNNFFEQLNQYKTELNSSPSLVVDSLKPLTAITQDIQSTLGIVDSELSLLNAKLSPLLLSTKNVWDSAYKEIDSIQTQTLDLLNNQTYFKLDDQCQSAFSVLRDNALSSLEAVTGITEHLKINSYAIMNPAVKIDVNPYFSDLYSAQNEYLVDLTSTFSLLSNEFLQFKEDSSLDLSSLNLISSRELTMQGLALTGLANKIPTDDSLLVHKYEEIDTEIESLPSRIRALDENFYTMYEGAILAIGSNNPDKKRHFLISFRELINNLLWQLAPRDRVLEWMRDNGNDNKKKEISRRDRLQYMFSRKRLAGQSKSFEKFMITDFNSFCDFYEILSKAHQKNINLSPELIDAILHRGKSFISYFVYIAENLLT